ncbi:DUF6412 domain-containing protein [Plantactinospora sp. WMMB334]|uniref:DUF6412 domain-containing protein n=1 Tax=Plantactinospora sp. WMMB334 TaxID=3404119 RepID=UPI003B92CE31
MPGTLRGATSGRARPLGREAVPGWSAAPPGWLGVLGRLAVPLGWLAYALIQLGTPTGPLVESLAGAAVLAAASLIAIALAGRLPAGPDAAVDRTRRSATFRQRSRRLRTPRQLDPDAAGRPRPRAPSVHPSAG